MLNVSLRKRVTYVLGLFAVLVMVGTFGYMLLEGWPLHEALFMTIITISTVGYGEVIPLSPRGEYFSIILILLGVGSGAYVFSVVTDYVIAGELGGTLRRQRMLRAIDKLNKHYIICGYGRVGEHVVDGLLFQKIGVVVIDADERHISDFDEKGVHYVIGDATDDAILAAVNIEHAAGLCSCLPDDATNVFAVLSARALNPNLFIIARCNAMTSEQKLRMAGADQIINPYMITGHRMAAQLIHPRVVEFLDVFMRKGGLELRIEEIVLPPDSAMSRQTLGEAHVRAETGVNVLAVRGAEADAPEIGPTADYQLHAGDSLICLGTAEQLAQLAAKVKVRTQGPRVPASR